MNRFLLNTLMGLGLSCLHAHSSVANRAIRLQPGTERSTAQEDRVALVIGNSAYPGATLRNAVNDAKSMKQALESCHFQVALLTDATRPAMEEAIRTFGRRLQGGAVGLFYFAGHGLQVRGENYLIPVGASLGQEDEIVYEAVNLGRVLDRMDAAKNPLNLLILDACRSNPFSSRDRGGGAQGLAGVAAPTGTLIAYATKPGSTATDGNGEHGAYTGALLQELREPGVKAEELFKRVRVRVAEATGNRQVPWESSSLRGDFYFRPLLTEPSPPPQAELEATLWEGLRDTRETRELEAFLQRFPAGAHGELARLKLANLRRRGPKPSLIEVTDPGQAIQRDPLETGREYQQRVASLGPLKVGTGTVSADNYDADSGQLALPVQLDPWARHWVKTGRVELDLDRAQVQQILAAGGEAALTAPFEIRDGRPSAGSLTLATAAGAFPASPEPPPVAGAVWNAEGRWEASLDLGPCRMPMVLIPAGTFQMGEPGTQHPVTLSHPFWMGKFLVTQAQWQAVMGNNPSRFQGADLPVEQVSWNDAQAFLGHLHGHCRLPTEAEWEYACRAGASAGPAENLEAIAWFDGNSGNATHPVGLKPANGFGLHDMLGNTWEWCQDWLGDYPRVPVTDPRGPATGSCRVNRGGGWFSAASRVGPAYRDGDGPAFGSSHLGFRVLKPAAAKASR